MKVKLFDEAHEKDLEEAMNDFLEELDDDLKKELNTTNPVFQLKHPKLEKLKAALRQSFFCIYIDKVI